MSSTPLFAPSTMAASRWSFSYSPRERPKWRRMGLDWYRVRSLPWNLRSCPYRQEDLRGPYSQVSMDTMSSFQLWLWSAGSTPSNREVDGAVGWCGCGVDKDRDGRTALFFMFLIFCKFFISICCLSLYSATSNMLLNISTELYISMSLFNNFNSSIWPFKKYACFFSRAFT